MPRLRESKVFFPWERRGVVGRVARGARGRLALLGVALVGLALWLAAEEERRAEVRVTRAALTMTHGAVLAFRADRGGACPKSLDELPRGGYLRELPVDAWGRALRLTCPGRRDARGFELESDGPDGLPGGLDRIQ